MIELPVKLSELKDLRELSLILTVPLFAAAYCLQFGLLAHPGVSAAMPWYHEAWIILNDCVGGIEGAVLSLCLLIYFIARLNILPIFPAMFFLTLGFVGLAAIEQSPQLFHVSPFWFWGCFATAFFFLPPAAQEKG